MAHPHPNLKIFDLVKSIVGDDVRKNPEATYAALHEIRDRASRGEITIWSADEAPDIWALYQEGKRHRTSDTISIKGGAGIRRVLPQSFWSKNEIHYLSFVGEYWSDGPGDTAICTLYQAPEPDHAREVLWTNRIEASRFWKLPRGLLRREIKKDLIHDMRVWWATTIARIVDPIKQLRCKIYSISSMSRRMLWRNP